MWVASGTYGGANGKAALKSFVRLYGGFTVGDTSKSAQNWKNNPTILDANGSGSVVTVNNAIGCVVDGFIIRNGGSTSGSGISCSNATAIIANNIIRGNNGSNYYGGGLYGSYSTLMVAGNVFLDNKAYTGAGIYHTNTSGQIANNTIILNTASSSAGGIYLASSSPALSNNILAFNTNGGIYKSGGTPTFAKNDVYGNSSYAYNWKTWTQGDPEIGSDLNPATSDPKITNVDWGDWHIAADSACRDVQGTTLAVSLDKDIDAGDRVYGTSVDIGADEWNGNDPTPVASAVFYVSPGGGGTKTGTSWANAADKVQTAIDAAYANGGGEVWVASGSYTGIYGKATLKSFVKVYGGFAVGDSSKSARNWKTNQAILDGGGSGSVVTVINALGCVVDGFTIKNGGSGNGSGINCSYATATIANNIIRANSGGSNYGGGLYGSYSTLTVSGNVFVDNKTGYGAGIYYTNTGGFVANNTIISNVASSGGGGIYLTSSSPALSNNIVGFNTGGGIYKSSGTPAFAKNDVYGNSSYAYSWKTWTQNDTEIGSDLNPATSDPKITNIDWGDWHISGDSPCRDPQGTTQAVPTDKDIDCESRVIGSTIDIGADEWNGTDPDPVTPIVFYVSPGGSGTKTGTSWANAADSLQTVINAAYSAGGGEIWVAGGTYNGINGKATLKSFVKIYGGFAIGDNSKSARNWKTSQTVLDGGASGSVVTMNNAVGCVIDGFVIRNGGTTSGSGINCSNATATIANNTIRGNNGNSNGGGIYASSASLTIVGNVLVDNKAYSGAGIYCTNTNGQIANNTIIRNVANTGCGGVYLYSGPPTLSNNIIAYNVGGGIYRYSSSPIFTKNIVYQNGKYDYGWTPVPSNDIILSSGNDLGMPNIDCGDWHISESSPCHDPQDTTLVVPIERDIDFEDRVYGSTVDIGADEWNGIDPTPVAPTVFYVSPGGSGAKTSTSWTNAADRLQTAIDAAYAVGGGEVWVAGGTYTGDNGKANLKPFVKVYGGFAIGDNSKSARNWKTNQTILDGGANGSVVMISNAVECGVDGFVIRNGSASNGGGVNCSGATATIANNIIRGNNASSNGGGIYGSSSTLILAGNVLIGNKASNYGAGIYYTSAGGQIANNTVLWNAASSNGGGIYLTSSSPALSNNLVTSNGGGGIYKSSGTPTFTKNVVYQNSKYEYSWTPVPSSDLILSTGTDLGIPNIDWGDWHISESSPCHDSADTSLAVAMDLDVDHESRVYGSTVDIGADEWNGSDPQPVTPDVIRVKPNGNDSNDGSSWSLAKKSIQNAITAANAQGGGEIWVKAGIYNCAIDIPSFVYVYGGFAGTEDAKESRNWKANLTILDAIGKGNSVVTMADFGPSAIDGFTLQRAMAYQGGGVSATNGFPVIANNIIKCNISTFHGAGIYSYNASPVIVGNWIVENATVRSDSYGGGIYCENLSATIVNNTINNNSSTRGGGVYFASNPSSVTVANNIIAYNAPHGIYAGTTAPPYQIRNNDLWQNGSNYSWTPAPANNISADPKITDPHNNPHIQPSSPCIDAGWDQAPKMPTLDLDKQQRPQGNQIDVGVDESDGTAWYVVTITANPTSCQAGGQLTYTIHVTDATGQAVSGCTVSVTVAGCTIVAITNNTTSGSIDTPPLSGTGTTNASGDLFVTVTAGDGQSSNGSMSITAQATGANASGSATNSSAYYTDSDEKVELVICHDVSGSMGYGARALGGLNALRNFVSTHAPWVTVTTITYGSNDCEDDQTVLGDALEVFSSDACRKFIALATDEAYQCNGGCYYQCAREGIIAALENAHAEVYIDGDTYSGDFADVAVNGSIEEALGTFSFPLLQKAIGGISKVDLDIDSDNNNDLSDPDRTEDEDKIEDTDGQPGKVIAVNNADVDRDGIVDYADGFNLDSNVNADDVSSGAEFVPIVLEIPEDIDLTDATIEFIYSASDPAAITASAEDPFVLPSGSLRIWTKNGGTTRNKGSIANGGDFVASGIEYAPDRFGLSETTRTVKLYVEAVKESSSVGDLAITAKLRPAGASACFTYRDTVNLTAVRMQLLAKSEDEEDFTEVDGFVATDIPENETPTGEGYSGAYQSYKVKIYDPRPGFSIFSINDQDVPMSQADGVYTTDEFLGILPEQQDVLDSNVPYELTIARCPTVTYAYSADVLPDETGADPTTWDIRDDDTPAAVFAVDGLLDLDSTGGDYTYAATLSNSNFWMPDQDTTVEVSFRMLAYEEDGQDGAFELSIGDGQSEWKVGVLPDALVTYPNGIRTITPLPIEIGDYGNLIDGDFHILRIVKAAGANTALISISDDYDFDLFEFEQSGNASSNFGITWGDTGADIQGYVQVDYVGWTHSGQPVDEPVYSKTPSDIVASKQVLHFEGEDISCGYDEEDVGGQQSLSYFTLGGITIQSDAPKSYKKVWYNPFTWFRKAPDADKVISEVILREAKQMQQSNWDHVAAGYHPNDSGAFGKELDKRVCKGLNQADDRWVTGVLVRNSDKKVVGVGISTGKSGHTQIDALACKGSYRLKVGDIFDHTKMDSVYDVKASVSGIADPAQQARLRALAPGKVKLVRPQVAYQPSTRTFTTNVKYRTVMRIMTVFGMVAATYACIHASDYDEELEEIEQQLISVKNDDIPASKRAGAVICVGLLRNYLSHFVPEDTAVNIVSLGSVYKILKDME